MEKSLAYRFT